MGNGMFKGRSLFCVVHLSIWSVNVIKDGPFQCMYFLTHVVSHLLIIQEANKERNKNLNNGKHNHMD
jgi:hypothetical protein